MLLHPATLKHHVAAASRGRYALNSIALMPGGVISTDGHGLLFIPYPDADPKEAPKIEGVSPKSKPPQVEPFLMALDDAAKVAGMIGRGNRHSPPITQFIQAQIEGDSILCGATDLSNAQTMRVRRLEGVYPDVGLVIPDYTGAKTTSVNLDQLLRTLKALRGTTEEDIVTLRIIDDQQAIGLSCKDGVCALTMPINVEKPEDHVVDQLAKLRPDAGVAGPRVAAPAEPDDEDDDTAVPSDVEVDEAQEVYNNLPKLPEPVVPAATATPKPRRRRRKSAPVEGELAEIIG